MDFYEKLLLEKSRRKLNNKDLGNIIDMSGETFRMAVNRKSLNKLQIQEIEKFFEIEQSEGDITVSDPPTGYYFPSVSASAGLEIEMNNDELKRVPINIPNWEKGIDFINVYGDSMYPKFCSGEIIGIKQVDHQFVNYGYAYVVILNDGQVFLKYIKKGKDDEHWLLASENPRYEPKEYHLSMIKKVFIIKGVITKTTM